MEIQTAETTIHLENNLISGEQLPSKIRKVAVFSKATYNQVNYNQIQGQFFEYMAHSNKTNPVPIQNVFNGCK